MSIAMFSEVRVISSDSHNDFQKEINKWLAQGYTLHGSMQVINTISTVNYRLVQMLAKPKGSGQLTPTFIR